MGSTRTTTQRGLGWAHQQQRERLLKQHVDGTGCWWCGVPMFRSQDLDADHTQARAHGGKKADRLLHRSCNRARQDGSRDHLRPAVTGEAVEVDLDDRARWCLLEW
ncbi:HNH endonuclease [Rhodococcus jostii]|uniref:HNH endonuclease n=1 Tax=Rhodococcus jostii TaxID=132919 RepID=UPI00362F5A02